MALDSNEEGLKSHNSIEIPCMMNKHDHRHGNIYLKAQGLRQHGARTLQLLQATHIP